MRARQRDSGSFEPLEGDPVPALRLDETFQAVIGICGVGGVHPVLRDAGVRCQHQRRVRGLLRRRPASALSQAASSRAVMARKSGTAQSG